MADDQAALTRIQKEINDGNEEKRDRDQSVKSRSLDDLYSIESRIQQKIDEAAGAAAPPTRAFVVSGL